MPLHENVTQTWISLLSSRPPIPSKTELPKGIACLIGTLCSVSQQNHPTLAGVAAWQNWVGRTWRSSSMQRRLGPCQGGSGSLCSFLFIKHTLMFGGCYFQLTLNLSYFLLCSSYPHTVPSCIRMGGVLPRGIIICSNLKCWQLHRPHGNSLKWAQYTLLGEKNWI